MNEQDIVKLDCTVVAGVERTRTIPWPVYRETNLERFWFKEVEKIPCLLVRYYSEVSVSQERMTAECSSAPASILSESFVFRI